MSIFSTFSGNARVNVSRSDKPGRYIQRWDYLKTDNKTKAGQPFLSVHKTTIRTINGAEQWPGDETSQAFFASRFSYTERDIRKIVQVAYGMTDDEVNDVPPTPAKARAWAAEHQLEEVPPSLEELFGDETLVGSLYEIEVLERPNLKKAPNEDGTPQTFTVYKWVRKVDPSELTEEERARFDIED